MTCLTQTRRFCKVLLYPVWRGQLERSAYDTYLTWTWYFCKVLTTRIWLNHDSFEEVLAIHISHKHEPAMKLWRINIIHLGEIICHTNFRVLKTYSQHVSNSEHDKSENVIMTLVWHKPNKSRSINPS